MESKTTIEPSSLLQGTNANLKVYMQTVSKNYTLLEITPSRALILVLLRVPDQHCLSYNQLTKDIKDRVSVLMLIEFYKIVDAVSLLEVKYPTLNILVMTAGDSKENFFAKVSVAEMKDLLSSQKSKNLLLGLGSSIRQAVVEPQHQSSSASQTASSAAASM